MLKLIKEIRELSDLRKHQQLMSFYMLFVGALLLAFTATLYIDLFGSEGLIYKDYFISLFGLVALIKKVGDKSIEDPMATFRFAVKLEFIAMFGYFLANKGFLSEYILIASTICLISANVAMKPLIIKVDSQVTNACSKYSGLKSKLDYFYAALGAVVGGVLFASKLPVELSFCLMVGSLMLSRYYRLLVFKEIYQEEAESINGNY